MNAPTGDNEAIMRARELEIEVARLNAELETLRGEGEPTDIAARFLTMAASTVDQAMEQARTEADELAAEVSAAAEARRDEATRIADEAEVRTESLRAEAANHEQVVEQARTNAADITAAAEAEAEALIQAERQRVADEIERLSSVREALESERGALEHYHDELKRRVQELAESMVAFMTTEPPMAAAGAIEDLVAPELAAGVASETEPEADAGADKPEITDEPLVETAIAEPEILAEPESELEMTHETEIADETEFELADEPQVADEPAFEITDELEPQDDDVVDFIAEPVAEFSEFVEEPIAEREADEEPTASSSPIDWSAGTSTSVSEPEPVVEDEPVSPFAAFGTPVADAPAEQPADEPVAEGPFAEFGSNPFAEPTVPAKPVDPSAFYDNAAPGASPSFADMMSPAAPETPPAPAGPPVAEPAAETGEFGGVPVVERETTASGLPTRRSRMGGLFGRGSAPAEPADEATPAEEPATTQPAGGLFGTHGARLIEQTSPEDLAAALSEESEQDERFRTFIDGDDDGDKSRDWLLRPEQS